MATDAKRTIEVVLKITGVDPAAFGKITNGFIGIQTAITNTITSLDSLKVKLESIKLPKNIEEIATSLKSISSIEKSPGLADSVKQLKSLSELTKFPNVKQVAEGFEGLAKIKTPPNLTNFVNELKKFSAIKVPNVKQIAEGFERLTSASLSMTEVGSRLRIIQRNLKRFSEIKVPNIVDIAKGLEDLNRVSNINIRTTSLNALATVLQKLNGLKIPNLKTFIESLQKMGAIDLTKVETSLGRLAVALSKFTVGKLPGVSALVSGFERLNKLDINKVIQKIKELDTALRTLDKSGQLKGFATFAADLRTVSSSLKIASEQSKRTKKAFEEAGQGAVKAARGVKSLNERISNYLQYRLIADVLFLLKDAFTQGLTAIMEYSQALKDLQAITGASSSEVEQMGVKIREVASTTKFSASEVAEGMRTLGQAGFTASESIGTMQAVSDLATGTLSGMSTTVDLVTTAMRVFKLEASESAMVSDVFANAVNRSKLTIDKLRTAMNYVGPIAKSAGVSFQEMSAAMMTLANSGLRASTIGTGLRRVFAELLSPSKKMAEAADKAGIALSDLNPRTRGLKEVISNLGIVLSDAEVAFDIFGKRGAAAALALSDTQGQFSSMLETVSKSGTAARMAAIQMEGLGVSFKNLKDKLGIFAIALGNAGITDIMWVLINVSRKLVDAFTVLVENPMTKFIIKAALFTTAGYGLIKVLSGIYAFVKLNIFTKLVTGLQFATASITAFATATTGAEVAAGLLVTAFNPLLLVLGLIIASVVAAGAALSAAKEPMENAAEAARKYADLTKYMEDYFIKVIKLKDGSEELANTNKGLRVTLLEISGNMTEVSDAAGRAAASINPLTGEIEDQNTALREYQELINAISLKKLTAAMNGAASNMQEQTSRMNRSLNWMKDGAVGTFNFMGQAASGFVSDLSSMFTVGTKNTHDFGLAFVDLWKNAFNPNATSEASAFAEAINSGSKSFRDINEYLAQFDGKSMTSQQKDIAEAFELMNEKATPLFNHLQKIGTIDTSYTVDQMKEILGNLGLSAEAADVLLVKFEKLKKAEFDGFSNIIEKWEKDTKQTSLSFNELYDKAGDAGRALTDIEVQRLAASKAAKKSEDEEKQYLVAKLNQIKREREEKLKITNTDKQNAVIQTDYHKKLQALLKESDVLRRKYAKEGTTAEIYEFDRLVQGRDEQIETLKESYKEGSSLFAKEMLKINQTFVKGIDKLLGVSIDPKALLKDTKTGIGELKATYAELQQQLQLERINKNISEKQYLAQKAKLEIELADKIENIWIDTYDAINEETGPDSASAIKARRGRLSATVKEGDLKVAEEKRVAEEIAAIQEATYELEDAKRETSHSLLMAKIANAEATGVISHEESEAAKLQISLDYYDKSYQIAKKRLSEVNESIDPDLYQERLQVLLQIEEKYYDERAKNSEQYNKKINSLTEKVDAKVYDYSEEVKKNNKKVEELEETSRRKRENINETFRDNILKEDKSYSKKVQDLEKDLADKIESINKDLAETLKGIDDDRIGRKKELKAELLGIEESTEDKIRSLNQRGMTDEQKEADNKTAAYSKLASAKNLMYEADKTGNEELAKQAASQISDAESLGSALEDTQDAYRLIREAGSAKTENALLQDKLKDLETEKNIREEIASAQAKALEAIDENKTSLANAKELHDTKITDLNKVKDKALENESYVFNKAIVNEEGRHAKRLKNLQKELDKLNDQLKVTKTLLGINENDRLNEQDPAKSNTSDFDSTLSTEEIQKIENTAKDVIDKIKKIDIQSKESAFNVNKNFSEAMNGVADSAKVAEDGFEKFIVVTDSSGRKVITTAKTMSQGFSAFGDVVADTSKEMEKTYDEAGKLKSVLSNKIDLKIDGSSAVSDINKEMPKEVEVELRVKDTLSRADDYINKIQKKVESIGVGSSGIEIIGPEQDRQIQEFADSMSRLFSGLNTDDPKQKLNDMITTMKGVGPVNEGLFNSMSEEILDYAKTVDGAGVRLGIAFVDGKLALAETSAVIDDTGNKYKGLSDKIQSNPLELFSQDANKAIIEDINNINGAVQHLHDRAEKEIMIEVDGEYIQRQATEAFQAFNELGQKIEEETITPKIDTELGVNVNQEELNQAVSDAENKTDDLTEEVKVPVTIESIQQKVEDAKTQIDSLSMKEVKLEVIVDNAQLDLLVTKLDSIIADYEDIRIGMQVGSSDDTQELVTWLEEIDKYSNQKVNISVNVEDSEEFTTLRDSIILLVSEPLTVLVDTFDALKNVRELADTLSDLVKKYDNKIINLTVKTKYTSSGTPPATQAAFGGLIQGFANGGDVFQRLLSPFISSGSGTKDDVPAMLMKGEYVHRQSAVQKYGIRFMEMINNLTFPKNLVPKFSLGGEVGSIMSSADSEKSSSSLQLMKFMFDDGASTDAFPVSINDANTMLNQFKRMGRLSSK